MPSKKNNKKTKKQSSGSSKPQSRAPGLRGRGDYEVDSSTVVPAVKGLEKRVARLESAPSGGLNPYSTVGEDVGSLFGMGSLGKKLGGAVGKLLGHGDYTVQTNSLMPGKAGVDGANMVPNFVRHGRRGIRVTEREYLGDVTGSVSFSNNTFHLNPGLNSTFPWLSTVAQSFDEWEPLGIVFEFRTTSGSITSTQALGKVIMATEYDPNEAAFTNAVQMENSDYACSVVASQSAMHGVECAPSERASRVYFVRSGPVPSGAVAADYDLGMFQVATQGMSATPVVGELWVSYDIALYKKQLYAGQLGNGVLYNCMYSNVGTSSTLFGTSQVQSGTFYVSFSPPSGTGFQFPKWMVTGCYMVLIRVTGGSTTVGKPTMTGTNCLINEQPFVNGGDTSLWSCVNFSNTGDTSTVLTWSFAVEITGPSAYVTFSAATLPLTPSFVQMLITQVASNTPPLLTSDTG